MQSLMDIVGRVEVTAEHPLEVWAQQCLDHLVPTRVMIFVSLAPLGYSHSRCSR